MVSPEQRSFVVCPSMRKGKECRARNSFYTSRKALRLQRGNDEALRKERQFLKEGGEK